MWIKYRQMFAWGYTKWEYIHCPDDIELGNDDETEYNVANYLSDLDLLNSWSDKWRKVEWEKVEIIPDKEINKKLKHHKNRIEHHKKMIQELEEMRDTNETVQ